MTTEIFEQKKKELYAQYEQNLLSLIKEYCIANNPYKIGDIVTDHAGSGRIVEIKIYSGRYNPCCIYVCENLTKSGTVNKREPKRNIYQSNIETL